VESLIRIYGDPVLRKKSIPVDVFDSDLEDFALKLKEYMYKYDGIGLAAPQTGHSKRIIVVDPTAGEKEPYILINPEIIYSSEEKSDYDEGCLSIPEITLTVNRPTVISVRAKNEKGIEYTLDKVDNLLARVLQHEIDHLDGILFVDRASPVRRQLIASKLKKMAKSHH